MLQREYYDALFQGARMPPDSLPVVPPHSVIPHLLEVQHVAHRLSASPEYVRRLIRERKLTAIRLGTRWRIDEADLKAFIDKQKQLSQNGNGHH